MRSPLDSGLRRNDMVVVSDYPTTPDRKPKIPPKNPFQRTNMVNLGYPPSFLP